MNKKNDLLLYFDSVLTKSKKIYININRNF